MNPLEIPELLLRIFYIGSESDIVDDDDLGSPPSIPLGYSHPRSPKPFFRSIVRVRKDWRQIVESVPSFWVTKVSLKWNSRVNAEMGLVRTGLLLFSPRQQFPAAEELLNGSSGSDIDISISFTWLSGPESSSVLNEFDQWMVTHIFSASDRVRQLSLLIYDPTLMKRVSRRCFSRSWTRLRTLCIHPIVIGPLAAGKVSKGFNAPLLSFASFQNVSWIEDQFGLANTSLSSLHIEHNSKQIPVDGFHHCTVMTYLSPSILSSLIELKLSLWDDERQGHVFSRVPPALSFPRLERLSLMFITGEDVWLFLKRVFTPRLTGLYIVTKNPTERGIPNEPFPPRFPLLEDICFYFVAPLWASVFLRLLPTRHNRLSTLSLMINKSPRGFDAPSIREKFYPQPMEIPNLQNLHFQLGTIDPWVFTNFNLKTTAGHLFLDYSESVKGSKYTQPGPLIFPDVTKMTVHRRKDLACVVAPALRHLILDLSSDHEGDYSLSKRLEEGQTPLVADNPLVPRGSGITVDRLETLGIGCIWIANLKLFVPFNNVHTLVICAEELLTRGGRLRFSEIISKVGLSIAEPVLPNLHTLGLSFEYPEPPYPDTDLLANDHFEAGLRLAQAFMRRRLGEGKPVRTLRIIGFLPKALEHGTEFTWIRNASGAKIEFARSRHDFALRLMRPC